MTVEEFIRGKLEILPGKICGTEQPEM